MFGYFGEADIAKTHKIRTVIRNHCLDMGFVKQLESCEADDYQDEFGKFLSAIGEYLITNAPGGFGKRMFTISQN